MNKRQIARKSMIALHLSRGHVLGRKWRSQRLPASQIFAIREIANKNGVGPAAIIETAMKQSSYGKEYRYLNSHSGLTDLEGQETLAL